MVLVKRKLLIKGFNNLFYICFEQARDTESVMCDEIKIRLKRKHEKRRRKGKPKKELDIDVIL